MKKLIFIALALVSLSSFARDVRGSGEIVIGNGQTTIGIRVGDRSLDQNMMIERILLLERAVRDLQIQVYNLSMNDLPSNDLYECRVTAFGKTYYGQGETNGRALSETRKACTKSWDEMFCRDIQCDKLK